nr:MAG TPA: hypothetical protein [Caudoviricetes sp.]
MNNRIEFFPIFAMLNTWRKLQNREQRIMLNFC